MGAQLGLKFLLGKVNPDQATGGTANGDTAGLLEPPTASTKIKKLGFGFFRAARGYVGAVPSFRPGLSLPRRCEAVRKPS